MDDCARFLRLYCDRCVFWPRRDVETEVMMQCPIMESALRAGAPERSGYPPEWSFDKRGRPRCTAFKKERS